jgi:hypothetical protein
VAENQGMSAPSLISAKVPMRPAVPRAISSC